MTTPRKFKSAHLKVDRAEKHVRELNALLKEKRPFRYILETNTKTRQRSIYAEKNDAVVDEASLIGADVLQSLRTAIDHAYWEIVSPMALDARSRKAVQFPFSETADRLEKAVNNRLAQRVSPEFFDFIVGLRPHGEAGGNQLLFLLHDFNATDKHRMLIPTADYKSLNTDEMRKLIPDFPQMFRGPIEFGGNRRDMTWGIRLTMRQRLGVPGLRTRGVFKQEINVPVQITFKVGNARADLLLVPTLQKLVGLVRAILADMERFA